MSGGKNDKDRKIRGSESAFMWGRTVYTDYATGCLRKIYLRSRGVRETISPIHGKRGGEFENQFAGRFAGQGATVEAEKVVRQPVDGYTDFNFSGRCDFVVSDAGTVKVHELKSTESKNVLREVIKGGKYKTENLAQLVAYMIAVGTDKGDLRYAYMEPGVNGSYNIKSERGFDVKVDDFGRIIIDGKPIRFTVYDQLAHQHAAANVIENDIIWDRPANFAAPFGSPCHYCPFKSACEKWDSGLVESVDGFIEVSKQCLKE